MVLGYLTPKLAFKDAKINIYDLGLPLHGATYHPNSFVLLLSYCANLKAI